MIYLVIGRRERGKTSLAVWMARRKARRAILDPRGMIHSPTADRIEVATDASDALVDMLDPVITHDGEPRRDEVIYSPSESDLDYAFLVWAESLKSAAREFPQREWAIVIDEASFFDLDTPAFQWLAKCTPRDRVHIFITAHRPQDVPTSIRSIADHWLVFAIRQEHDLKALRDRSAALASTAEKLQDRDFAWWNDANGELKINRQPQSWRLNLSSGA